MTDRSGWFCSYLSSSERNLLIQNSRYYKVGSFSIGDIPAYDVSIIEEDMYQELVQESLRSGNGKGLRRNIIVSGCSLASLIGQPFQIGTTLLQGIMPRRLKHLPLEQVLAMRLNTGIGAQVLSEGTICLEDDLCLVKEHVMPLNERAK